MDVDQAFEEVKKKAYRLLSYRPQSIRELRTKLLDKGYAAVDVERVIVRFTELKFLDDEAFAKGWARSLAVNRLWGDRRIYVRLREKGIDTALIDDAIRETREELTEEDAVEKLLIKKYGKNISSTLHFNSFSAKEKRRIIQYVTSRGFPAGLLLEVLRKPKEEYTDDRE